MSKVLNLGIAVLMLACTTSQFSTVSSAVPIKRSSDRQNAAPLTDAQAKQNNQEIREKIEKNVVLPPSVSIKTLPVFTVTLKSTGEVLDVELKQSSGSSVVDTAIMRAIWKSSPLPLPETGTARQQLNIIWNPKNIKARNQVITL